MKPRFRTSIINTFLLLALAVVSCKSIAAECSVEYKKVWIVINSLKIDPNVPTGSVLHSQLVNTRTYPASFNCGNQTPYYASEMGSDFSTESAISGVYETGLSGIGIRVRDIVYNQNWAPYVKTPAVGSWDGRTTTGVIRIELIKTGEINANSKGKLKSGTLVTAKVNSLKTPVRAKTFYEIYLNGGSTGGWTVKSCTIDNAKRNQTVQMGKVSKSDFDSSGYGPVVNFKININCPDGIPNNTPIKITYDRMTSGSSNGFMDIDSSVADAAKNVGVEVRDKNNSLLVFSSDYTYTNNDVSNKEISIPMTARYKATSAVKDINPGTANTAMTITITQD